LLGNRCCDAAGTSRVYTKGTIVREAQQEVVYILVSSKRATRAG